MEILLHRKTTTRRPVIEKVFTLHLILCLTTQLIGIFIINNKHFPGTFIRDRTLGPLAFFNPSSRLFLVWKHKLSHKEKSRSLLGITSS